MNEFDTRVIKDLFARIFVLAVLNKVNFSSFIYSLERSKFVEAIEKGAYSDYFNQPIITIFYQITGYQIDADKSFGIYNDAYWCGYSYFELYQVTKKSFAFIFLKLPFEKMMNVYSIFHEMDFSSLLDYFYKKNDERTILKLLCENKHCSLSKLSIETGISRSTLVKYNSSDENLYKASFQNLYLIAKYFDIPLSTFAM